MTEKTTIICDRCQKEISPSDKHHKLQTTNGRIIYIPWNLCEDCYDKFQHNFLWENKRRLTGERMTPICANCGKSMSEAGFCCKKCHDEYYDNLKTKEGDTYQYTGDAEAEEMYEYTHR